MTRPRIAVALWILGWIVPAALSLFAVQVRAQDWQVRVETKKLCPSATGGRLKFYRANPGVVVTLGNNSTPSVPVDAFTAVAVFKVSPVFRAYTLSVSSPSNPGARVEQIQQDGRLIPIDATGAASIQASSANTNIVVQMLDGDCAEQAPSACNADSPEQQRATREFRENLLPVLRHPRCANCHGALDIFDKNTSHPGGSFPDEEGHPREKGWAACAECHDAAPKDPDAPEEQQWRVVITNIARWGQASEKSLCGALKASEQTAGQFMQHIKDDTRVKLGFAGKRGHSNLGPMPPPRTHAQFTTAMESWIDAMGGEKNWGDAACGCQNLSDSAPQPVKACGAALENEFNRLNDVKSYLQLQQDHYVQKTPIDTEGRESVLEGIQRLGRAGADAGETFKTLGRAIENALLKPFAEQIEAEVMASTKQSAKDKLLNNQDVVGAVGELTEGWDLKEKVKQAQQERQALQQEWGREFQRLADAAGSVAQYLPPSSEKMAERIGDQVKQIDSRISQLRALADETRCELPAYRLSRKGALLGKDAVLLGLHPPLDDGSREKTDFVKTTDEDTVYVLFAGTYMTATGRWAALLSEYQHTLTMGGRAIASKPGVASQGVTTPEARVDPKGTSYLVYRDQARWMTFVHVAEGSVTVTPSSGAAALNLAKGQSALVTAQGATLLRTGQSGSPSVVAGIDRMSPVEGVSCFGNDRGAASIRRDDHLGWARSNIASAAANLRGKIDTVGRCMSKADLDSAFADLSVLMRRYIGQGSCSGALDDVGVLGLAWAPHRDWARARSAQQVLDNLQWKYATALSCLNDTGKANLYADASVALAKALLGMGGDPGPGPSPVAPPSAPPPPAAQVEFKLWTDSGTARPGESFNVYFQKPGGRGKRDWIGLYAAGATNEDKLWWLYTDYETTGKRSFNAPAEPGSYELRLLLDDGYDQVVARTGLVVVAPGQSRAIPSAPQPMRPSQNSGAGELGQVWSESEAGNNGIWTRRPGTNIFDGYWAGANVRAVLDMSLSGDRVTIRRTQGSDGYICDYTGIITGNQVSGTFGCNKFSGQIPWRATIDVDAGATNGPVASVAGHWGSSIGFEYDITQSGSGFSWRVSNRPDLNETGSGEFLSETRIKATWANNRYSGAGEGQVLLDASGRATRIEWNNGVVFTRP